MTARAPLCLLLVGGFLIKKVRLSAKFEGQWQRFETTSGASQPAGTRFKWESRQVEKMLSFVSSIRSNKEMEDRMVLNSQSNLHMKVFDIATMAIIV